MHKNMHKNLHKQFKSFSLKNIENQRKTMISNILLLIFFVQILVHIRVQIALEAAQEISGPRTF